MLPELKISRTSVVSMSNVVKDDGSVEIPNNKLGLTLVNIEEEGIVRDVTLHWANPDHSISHLNSEIRLNLLVLFVVHFTDQRSARRWAVVINCGTGF